MLAEGFHSLSGRSTEDTFTTVLPRAVDLEEADRETTNLLVFLLMQFLSRFVIFSLFVLYCKGSKVYYTMTYLISDLTKLIQQKTNKR